jgi:Golgi apparatus protein 1
MVDAGITKKAIISLAPDAMPANDIDPTGNCQGDIKTLCASIEARDGRIAECLSSALEAPEGSVSAACREEVYQFKISKNSNVNSNVKLAMACKVDAEANCNVTWLLGYKAGQVITCLKEIKEKLAPACKREISKLQADTAEDIRADAQIFASCKADADNLCSGVPNGGGRVQGCLRDHQMQLSWECLEKLNAQEEQDADDVRLSVRLFTKCLADKKRFCADVEPGHARVKDCLEENRLSPDFSPECKEEINSVIQRRVRDVKLDFRLRNDCAKDIETTCASSTVSDGDDGVIRCLQDFVDEVKSDKCRDQIHKYQTLAAEDLRFDSPLADACSEDRKRYCESVPYGSARVIRCLIAHRAELSSKCRATLFDEEVRFSSNIDFHLPMKKACGVEVEAYCKGIPSGEARMIRCLQDTCSQPHACGAQCLAEVKEFEAEASSDYRFNYRLAKACKEDVEALCKDACDLAQGQVCGGSVLRCLTEKRDDLKSEACASEVLYFEKMEVNDFRNDVILAAACRNDMDKFCSTVEPGEGRVHACLRSHRSELQEGCRREELILEEQEQEVAESKSGIVKTCREERELFCSTVAAGGARVFRCLADNMNDPDFGSKCRNDILTKLLRRQANWKLDPPLRMACKDSVRSLCAKEDAIKSEEGAVYKCMIRQYTDLGDGCQKELGRALHMAVRVWQPGAILTSVCDGDIRSQCLKERPNMAQTPGAIGQCLASIVKEMEEMEDSGKTRTTRSISEECRSLIEVAEPPDMRDAFDASLSLGFIQAQLEALEGPTGLNLVSKDSKHSVTLTGWTALTGVASFVLVLAYGINLAVRRIRGGPESQGYSTLVLKNKH